MHYIKQNKYLLIIALLGFFCSGAIYSAQNSATAQDWTVLLQAIANGNLDIVKRIVPTKIAADSKTRGGKSLISIATYSRRKNIVDYLESLMPLEFYDKNKPYYEFTNFYQGQPIDLDGQLWPTSEHYFQAMKFIGQSKHLQNKIRMTYNPRDVFTLANSKTGTYKQYIRPDWENVKDALMYNVVFAKFSQDYRLKNLLLSTGQRYLIEASPFDAYWGWGPHKNGQNKLGLLLMRIRNELRQPRTNIYQSQGTSNVPRNSSVNRAPTRLNEPNVIIMPQENKPSWYNWITRGIARAAAAVVRYTPWRYR